MNIGIETEVKPGNFAEGEPPKKAVASFHVSMDPATAVIFNFFTGGTIEDFSKVLEAKLRATISDIQSEMEQLRKKPATKLPNPSIGSGRGRKKGATEKASNGKETSQPSSINPPNPELE